MTMLMRMFPGLLILTLLSCAGGTATTGGTTSSGGVSSSSSTGGASSSAGQLQACDALTTAELQTATTRAFQAGVATATGATSQCGWDQVSDPNNEGGMNLTIYHGSGMSVYMTTLNAQQGWTTVSNLGDEAAWHPQFTYLIVRRGTVAFQIDFNFNTPPPTQAMAEQLARLILGRL